MTTSTGDPSPLPASTERLLRALRAVEARRGRADALHGTARRLLGTGEPSRVEAVLAFQAEMIATLAEAVSELQAHAARGSAVPPSGAGARVAALAEEIVDLHRQVDELKTRRAADER